MPQPPNEVPNLNINLILPGNLKQPFKVEITSQNFTDQMLI